MKKKFILGISLFLLATTSANSTNHYFNDFIKSDPICHAQNSTKRGYCNCLQLHFSWAQQDQQKDISKGKTTDEESADVINDIASYMETNGCLAKYL